MNPAKLAIVAFCLACWALSQAGCAAGTFRSPIYGGGWTSDYGQPRSYYGQPLPYYGQPYEYRDPYGYQRPYDPPGMGQRPYWYAPRSRVFSPNPGVSCDRRKAVCYKWHKGSGEWRPDRSDTKDNFGKKAARRLKQ
jgi:hypothetical protein